MKTNKSRINDCIKQLSAHGIDVSIVYDAGTASQHFIYLDNTFMCQASGTNDALMIMLGLLEIANRAAENAMTEYCGV